MKGQIRIEFIFGVVIFIIIIFLVITQTNTLYSSLLGDSRKDALKAKAINVIDILVEDTGYPPNWDIEEVPIDVVLINDISASMDGKAWGSNVPYRFWGVYCRIPCNVSGAGSPSNNGCNSTLNHLQVDNATVNWTDPNTGITVPSNLREVWPFCADCDNDTDRADPNESTCPSTASKDSAKIFVDQLNSSTDRSALVTFDQNAHSVINLTSDKNAVKTAISNFINWQGDTEIGVGIDNATHELAVHGSSSSKWVEILLTDGQDSVYDSQPVQKATNAHNSYGIIIYTIGYGSVHSINEPLLKNISSVTGGDYFYSPDSSTLADKYLEIAQRIKANITRIGLAVSKPYNTYNISSRKVSRLYENCNFLDNMNLGTYRLKIYNSTGNQILFCGYDSLEPPLVMETRYVYIAGDFGKVTLEMW